MFVYFNSYSQNDINKLAGKWDFKFYVMNDIDTSIVTNYHATDMIIRNDSSFSMGMSEAAHYGKVLPDLKLSFKMYDWYTDTTWFNNWSIHYLDSELLILKKSASAREKYFYDSTGDYNVYLIYSKTTINNYQQAQKYFRRIKKYTTSP